MVIPSPFSNLGVQEKNIELVVKRLKVMEMSGKCFIAVPGGSGSSCIAFTLGAYSGRFIGIGGTQEYM